jgi:glycerophosphoryl diester phosphodiesterase
VAQAIADRADFVELDVRLTKDGVPVVLHDADLKRTTDAESVFPGRSPWALRDFTLDEVRRLDAGSWRSGSYARERVPTLAAVLRQLSRSPSGVYLHVKNASTYGGVDGIGAKVYETVKAGWPSAWTGDGPRRVVVQSAEKPFVEEFAGRYPEVPVAVIQRSSTVDGLAGYADDVQVRRGSVTSQMVADAHDAGLTIGAWTVDDRADMASLAGDLDSIVTNYPARLRNVLARRGLTYTGTTWPDDEAGRPSWTVRTFGRYLHSPVTVRARLTATDGSPARWQWARVQRRVDGVWRTVAQRATDGFGRFTATIPGSPDLRVRVVNRDSGEYPIAASSARSVGLRKMASTVRVSGPRSVRPRRSATLTVRWHAADGGALSGRVRLYRLRADGTWRHVRDLRVSDGLRRTRVTPGRRSTRYKVRALPSWWHAGDVDYKRVRVLP